MTDINGKQSLTLQQIFAPRELPKEFVPVPEWGDGGIWIAVMNGTQRDAWESAIQDRINARAKLVLYAAVRDDGKPLFDVDQLEQLGQQSSIVLDRLANVALRLNRLSDKAMEETKGNSKAARGDAQS